MFTNTRRTRTPNTLTNRRSRTSSRSRTRTCSRSLFTNKGMLLPEAEPHATRSPNAHACAVQCPQCVARTVHERCARTLFTNGSKRSRTAFTNPAQELGIKHLMNGLFTNTAVHTFMNAVHEPLPKMPFTNTRTPFMSLLVLEEATWP